ncbi:MAG: hypothetical protein R3B53_00935 [Candidatus Paceibacterota bacterium]
MKIDIEEKLKTGKDLQLSVEEKTSMKAFLLSQATLSLNQTPQPSPYSIFSTWQLRAFSGAFAVFVIFFSTGYLAQGSLPGDTLYPVKVNVIEEIIALTHLEPTDKVGFEIERLNTRLEELTLVSANQSEPVDLTFFAEQVSEHVSEAVSILNAVENTDAETAENKISLLSKLNDVTQKHEDALDDTDANPMLVEKIGESSNLTETTLTNEVDDYLETEGPETSSQYLSEAVNFITDNLDRLETSDQDNIEKQLQDVNEAITDGDMAEAIITILEAKNYLQIDS